MNERADTGRRLVVFVVPDFVPTLGGTTRQTTNQATSLQRRGYDVLVLTQRIDRAWPRHELVAGLPVERIGPGSRSGLAMKVFVLHVAWWLWRHRRSVTIVQSVMYPDFVVAAGLAGMRDIAVMCWAGKGDATDTLGPDIGVQRAPLRALRRWALRRAAHVGLTEAIREELAPLLPDVPVEVVPTPVDTTRYEPPTPAERAAARAELGIEGDATSYVFTGHLRALKRVDLLLDAFAVVARTDADAVLYVVGGSRADLEDTTAELAAQRHRLGLDERVHFTGPVDDVRPYLVAADVFVLPSDREGLSNALLEALACGLPGVAAPSAGGDMILDETCGIVPATNRVDDLAAAMVEMLSPEVRAHYAHGSRPKAEAYGINSVSDRYERIYARCRATRIGGGSTGLIG